MDSPSSSPEHPPQGSRAREVFTEALARPTQAERESYLQAACRGDEPLSELVLSLLKAYEGAGSFLEMETTPQAPRPLAEEVGERIGHYKLLQKIGEGGCGVVYLAEQSEPVRRRVALKIIKIGMDTRMVVARFDAERQALAMMDHVNIAKVFDAGATQTGRPYFVMELIEGAKITEYCDQNHLSTAQRLHLFLDVCRGVQHAHQKGIIHRDLKPSNILVAIHDGKPIPKIIDFGIAKATTDQQLTDATLFTALEQFVGTPAYMSPEHAAMSGADLDTRSDIYSLGVLLYELLTGVTPFDAKQLLKAGLDEIRRTIREQEPSQPSTRLGLLGAAELARVAQQRHADASELIKAIHGDLDSIVMKALEKDRARRYGTANGLADDIQRHLNDEPVIARPPGNLYRLQKTIRRHKLGFLAASAVVMALILGLGLTTWQSWAKSKAYRRAIEAERAQTRLLQAAQEAKARETQQRDRAEATAGRLAGALERLELERVEELFHAGDSPTAMAYLARALRHNSTNLIAAERLLSAWTHRRFALSSIAPIRHSNVVSSAEFSLDGRLIVTASSDATAGIWDSKTGLPLTRPLSHANSVLSARFSPDAKRVITACLDGTVQIWDARSGEPLGQPLLQGQSGIVYAEFSPDGERVVTAAGREARIWDAKTAQALTEPLKHSGAVWMARFSPEGLRVVTASEDKTARVWDSKSGQALTAPLKHKHWVAFAQFSPDGQQLVTACRDGTVQVWDANTGRPGSAAIEPRAPARGSPSHAMVDFSPDGQRLLVASGMDLLGRVWDVKTSQQLGQTLKQGMGLNFVQFSPDGQRFVTAAMHARVWDAINGQPLTPPLKHELWVTSARFSPDGQRVLTASADHTVRIWDVKTDGPLTERLRHAGMVRWAEFSRDGARLLTASSNEVQVWDAKTHQPLTGPLPHQHWVPMARFSPDGRWLLTICTNEVRIWDVATGRQIAGPLKHEETDEARRMPWQLHARTYGYDLHINSAQFSPDGRRLVTACGDGTARLWDTVTGQPLTNPLTHDQRVWSAQFSPDGQFVVTAAWDHTAQVWNAQTGQPISPPLRHDERVWSAQFSPDSQQLVTASIDKTARLWNVRTGAQLTESLKHEGAVYFAEFSPDGLAVLTASADKTARIWDAKTGAPLTDPLEHENDVSSAHFSPDGKRIVTSGSEARIWDAKTGQPISELFWHDDYVNSAEFSPDGQRVVTTSGNGPAQFWELPKAPLPVPEWVPQLAEAIAEKRINDQAITEPVPPTQLEKLKRQLSESNATDIWTRAAQWLFQDQSSRTISPFSTVTLAEYVQGRTEENTLTSLHEAVRLAPTNGLALARLARAILSQTPNENPRQLGEADWYSARAVKSAPKEMEAWWARAEVFARSTNRAEAIAAFKTALTIQPENPVLWESLAGVLTEINKKEEADHAYTRALEFQAPKDAAGLMQLARQLLDQISEESPRRAFEADWYSRRAVDVASGTSQAWLIRAEVCERMGKLTEALEAIRAALKIDAQDPDLWNAEGRILEKIGRIDAAHQSLSKAIELAAQKAKFYFARSSFLERQKRFEEAAQDLVLAKFPRRDPRAKPEQLDLTLHYNASLADKWHAGAPSNLDVLPQGLQVLGGVEFDVRGMIQLGAETGAREKYPNEVLGIAVGRVGKRLHFLHSAINAFDAKDGLQIGSYVVHYSNGQKRVIPLVMGKDLADWWSQPNEENKSFVIAWSGANELARQLGRTLRLFKTTWENPFPDLTIQTIDFASTTIEPNPFLVAITVE